MPQPTLSDVHVNRPLTNISIAFLQKASDFVSSRVFPNIAVAKQSDRYFVYDRDSWFRDDAAKRAPSTESAGTGYTIDNTPTYSADVWALHKDVSDQVRANTDVPLDADRDATLYISQKMLLRKEKEFTTKYFKTGIWTGSTSGSDITPGTLWDNAASTPIEDIDEQADAMGQKTGFRPNKLVVSPAVHTALKNHPDIRDRIKYVQKAILTEDILATLFGVEEYIVARATNNVAKEGAAASMSYLFGKHAMLVYSNPTPSLLQPSAGYVFSWTGLLGAGALGTRMKKFRMDWLESDRVEGDCAFDMKQIAPDLGVFFASVVA